MANNEFLAVASTLQQFEIENDIKEFNIDLESTLPDNFKGTKLSFEDDVLSFENDRYEETEVLEIEEQQAPVNTTSKSKLNLSKEDFSKVINWLDNIRANLSNSERGKALRKVCSATKDAVIKKSITYDELYSTLEEISKRYNNL